VKGLDIREGIFDIRAMMTTSETVHVELGERSYEIRLGTESLGDLGAACLEVGLKGKRVLVVSDENVAPLYLDRVADSLASKGLAVTTLVLPAGEPTKSAAQLAEVWEAAVEARLDRKSFLVALGGGVIGDLGGLGAASFLRGVPFVQVPTSLLAMVDSAVGGKTGINLPQGKNLVGAFHQPALVSVDLSVLRTLPAREFHAGMAEVIKYGVIHDAELFDFIEANADRLNALEADALRHVVRRSCEIKADVVRQDEREGGLRAILNFGHTLGHAIENVRGYGEWLHGEAIAAGMVYAARVSERVHGFPAEDTERLTTLLRAFDLPVAWEGLEWEAVYTAMTADKKAADAVPRFVLARSLGDVGLPEEVDADVLRSVFTA